MHQSQHLKLSLSGAHLWSSYWAELPFGPQVTIWVYGSWDFSFAHLLTINEFNYLLWGTPGIQKIAYTENCIHLTCTSWWVWTSNHTCDGFPGGSDGKAPVCSAGDQGRSLGQEDPLEKDMAIHVLLPGKSHGQRNLVGYSPWGRKESDTTERLHLHTFTITQVLTCSSPPKRSLCSFMGFCFGENT